MIAISKDMPISGPDVTVIRAEGVNISPEARQNAIENARRIIGELNKTRLAA